MNSVFPISFAQQRLWFMDQLEPGTPVYNMPLAARWRGALDPRVLARTLSEIVRRHEALRTTFRAIDGQPVQQINCAEPVNLPVADLSGLMEVEREREADRLA